MINSLRSYIFLTKKQLNYIKNLNCLREILVEISF